MDRRVLQHVAGQHGAHAEERQTVADQEAGLSPRASPAFEVASPARRRISVHSAEL